MPTATVTPETLEIRLSAGEKVAGLLRDLRVPRSAVTSVEVLDDGLSAAHGLRAPGFALPGRRKVGTWRGRGTRQFVAVRRGVPALRLQLQGARFSSAVVSLDDAADVAARLRGWPLLPEEEGRSALAAEDGGAARP